MNKPILACLGAFALLGAPAFGQTPAADVEAQFIETFTDICALDADSAAAQYYPSESWDLTWQTDYSDTRSEATLHQFFCSAGAYNVNLVYYLSSPDFGASPLAFAVPQYDVKYVDDDFDAPVESITLVGFTTQLMLTNPQFDPETQTLTNTALWRGIGDASSGGRWVFEAGTFVLKVYDVDASYDGEINPERIVDFP